MNSSWSEAWARQRAQQRCVAFVRANEVDAAHGASQPKNHYPLSLNIHKRSFVMIFRHRLTALAVASLGTSLALAQTAEPQTMRQITVTGSTIDDRFGDSAREPASVVNLSGRQIEAQHVDNMVQVLKAVPGVTVDYSGGDDLKIKFRGVENQRYMGEKPGVAIVIDGVPVFERTGKVNVNLDNIESIKVIKGGASYLFGEDALSGAVIITTKRGATNKGIVAEADAGAYGYRRELARFGFASDTLSGHVQVSGRSADDYHFQSNYKSEAATGNLRWLVTPRSDLTLGLEQENRFRDKHGTVTGVRQAEEDPTGIQGRDYARHFDVALQRANLTYSNDLSDKTNLLALAYQYTDHTEFWSAPQRFSATGAAVTAPDAYTTLNDYAQTQRGVKTELRTSNGALALMGGAEAKRNSYLNLTSAKLSYRNSPFGATTPEGMVMGDDATTESVQALYGEAKWSPVSDWTITGNARGDRINLDYHAKAVAGTNNLPIDQSKTFHANSYRLGVAWTGLKNSTVYASVSTGFRAPTVDQLYRGSQSPSTSVANNPDLKPEQATSYELGLRKAFSLGTRDAQLEAAVFQIDRKDFILDTNGQYSSANAANVARYENIGGTRSRGFELSVKSSFTEAFTWDMAYTYLNSYFTQYNKFLLALGNPRGTLLGASATCKQTSAAFSWNNCYSFAAYNNTGNQVPRVPPHALNLRSAYKLNTNWRFGAELDYRATAWADEINQEKWPGRTVFNATVDYSRKVNFMGNANLSAFLRLDNAFAQKYYLIARGTNDSQSYATAFKYDGVYNAQDMSITTDPGRVWRAGLALRF